MYLGEIVESAPTKELFSNPLHPYTKALLQSIPQINKNKIEFKGINGEAQTNSQTIEGCKFAKRCSFVMPECNTSNPREVEKQNQHFVKCFLTN